MHDEVAVGVLDRGADGEDLLVLDGQLEGRRLRAMLRKVPLLRRTT